MTNRMPTAPETHEEFSRRFPKLRQGWDILGEAGHEGPLDEKSARLIKLAVSIGAMREGAVHSAMRKALASGVSREEIDQVIALCASTIGLPATVAIFTWIEDVRKPE